MDLSVLSKVIRAITQMVSWFRDEFVSCGGMLFAESSLPFRDSKLTHFLQPSLEGDSKPLMICALSPLPEYPPQSLASLRFAKEVQLCEIAHRFAQGWTLPPFPDVHLDELKWLNATTDSPQNTSQSGCERCSLLTYFVLRITDKKVQDKVVPATMTGAEDRHIWRLRPAELDTRP